MTEGPPPVASRSASWSTSGLTIGFIALVAAVISPWIVDSISPPTKTIDAVAVDVAVNIKDQLVAKAKGQEFVAKPKDDKTPSIRRWYPLTTIGIGLLGMCLGVVGFTRHEDTRMSASAVTIGLAAIVFQYFLLLAAAIILILLIGFILNALGIDLPSF
ncbi:hypothetical protein [Aureliella helgolandensis]|uniref:Uncharacterized protein n=1 Tax=Aureliella helgolandensis TaxID=2527968 RepID=A0A518G0T5_9BACT|nr:hypothetical protein [Aureliella helgolandensis]QDV22218.1 hypothetical protein Q31a_05020 [Aureliella helgolandensis]